ncbi:MAG: tetratricopeptide repeat protein [bacterium]
MAKTEAELREVFQNDPAQVDAFIALRRIYQHQKRFNDLAELYEKRAAAMTEGIKAAELYSRAADIRFEKINDEDGGTRCLLKAVKADSTQRRPVEKLRQLLRDSSRWEEYLQLLATLADARAGDPTQARTVARLHLEMGTLFEEHFSRTDKAMYHYQQACRLDATLVPALQAARRIYRQTGDWPMFCRLMEAELAVTTGAKARFELLLSLAQIQTGRLHDLTGAAQSLQDALAARPGDVRALAALANIYANPDWVQEGGRDQAAKIFVQIAQIHRTAKEIDECESSLQRALRADPVNREAFRLLEDLHKRTRKYQELEQLYAGRLELVTGAEVIDLLMKRAGLLEEHLGNRPDAIRCYESILPHEPPGGAAAAMLAELYQGEGEWKKLAALKEAELEVVDDVPNRIGRMMELALIYRDELSDEDKAGILLHNVLQMDPNHPEALDYYRDHFRNKGDFRGLADLIAFSIEGAIESRVRRSLIVAQLKELAEIAEQRLGDLPRAMDAWRRIQEVDPTQLEARDAMRRLAKKERMWASLLAALERDLQMAATHEQQIDALLRMGQAYHDKGIDPLRGIEILEEVLRSWPGEPTALALLRDLYDREGNLEGLSSVYRRQLDIVHDPGERLEILRDLAELYHVRLKQLRETGWACTQILEMVPGDEDALRRLTDVLEEMQDWPKLIKTLKYHAQTADGLEERTRSYRRIADIAEQKLQDAALAAEAWEGIRGLYPDHQDALRQLLSLYERLGQWERLADLLEDMSQTLAAGDEGAHQSNLRRLARVADTRLGDSNRALEAWRAVSEMLPTDQEALAALARLYYQHEDWENLADVMERQIPLTDDDQKAVNLCFRLAEIMHGKLDNPKEAIDILEGVLDKYDPGNVDALERLRQLYAAIGETAKSVRIAERQLLLVDGEEKIRLTLDIAAAWRDDVGDDEQAIKAYELVLESEPSNADALSALVVLYTRTARWQELIATNQLLFDFADNDRERLRLLYQIAEVYEERLDEPVLAFNWYRKAYQLYPQDRGTLTSLSRAAAEHGLWEELIEVYEEVRAQAQTPADHLEAAGRIAEICEQKLSDPTRAFDVLRGALVVDLTGVELLPELERLCAQTALWDGIVEVYERVLKHQREPEASLSILHRCARALEDHLGDPAGALLRLRRAFQIDSTDETTQPWLLRVAEEQASWQDVLDVYAAQYTAAATLEEKLDIIRLAAPVTEDRVGDKVKAFRAWLHAFLMAHEDPEIVEEVWRLAREIGDYSDAVRAEDLRARQQAQRAKQLAAEPNAQRGDRPLRLGRLGGHVEFSDQVPRFSPGELRPEITQELDINELEFVDDAPPPPQRQDPTMELRLSDLVDIQSVRTGRHQRLDATMELQLVDLMDISQDRPLTNPQARQPEEPREPQAAPSSDFDLPPAKSAWEEFSRAWAMLPAPDVVTKIRHCHEIARLWREGPADLDRAYWALRKALELEPLHPETQQVIEEVAQEAEALEPLAETYLEILGTSHGVDLIVALNMDAARLFRKAGKDDRAETRYKEILSIQPDHHFSFEQLQEMFRAQERWSELAELDERQMDDMLDQLPAGPERQAKLRELAELYEEKLDQPYEALSVLQRLHMELPDDLDAWRAVARLAERTESWAKAVEAMAKVEEITGDDAEAHQVRRRVASIYRHDLELPDRAIDCYRRLAEEDPSDDAALLALQELLEEHESWEGLEDVLARRAELVSGQEWIDLIRHRARVLGEHLKSPAEAAACLRQLYAEHSDDEELASELIRLLRSAEEYDEAATILRERIENSEAAGAPRGETAALLVKLAVILAQDLGDAEAARTALERALETVPDYPSALAELARLHKHDEDWEGFAEARMREVNAAPDKETKLLALLEAAEVFRDKLNDRAEAKSCLDRALKLDAENYDALGGLAELAASAGDWKQALELHRQQLQLVEAPEKRAALLTTMGTLILTGGQDEDQATALFQQALQEKSDDVPAVIALADISYRNERWGEAEELLETALRRLDGQPAMAARLGHRLGSIHLRLDKLEEGKRILQEIDRKNPNQFLLKLALGMNRFNARRWREAARVLSALQDHPDASQFQNEVAEACCIAAEAETRQRRPTKAPALWEAALQFKPDHMPAIDALVSYHTERGATADAARYLRAQADATTDAAAKVQLLDSLGDLYLDKLEDDGAALGCFREALEAAEPVESRHLPILEKLFPLCRSLGDDAEAARVIGLILAFTEDSDLRMPREIQAADAYLALGEVDRAQRHLQNALELDPSNEQATVALVDLYDQTGQYKELADLLHGYLGKLEEASEEAEWSRRAALYERLAETYRHGLEHPQGAIEALEKALELDPTRLSCREILSELYGEAPEYDDRAFLNNLALVATDVKRPQALRNLARVYTTRGDVDKAYCIYRLLDVMGQADLDELGFIAQNAPRELAPDEIPSGVLQEEDRAACLAHPDTKIMVEVFSTLWEGAPALFGQGLEALGISAQDRISPVADMDLARVYGAAARVLGNRHTGLYLGWENEPNEVRIACHAPPVITVGPDVEQRPLGELRFLLGRALELTRPEYIIVSGLDRTEFSSLFAAVLRAFHPRHSRRRGDDSDPHSNRAAQLKKDLPYRVSRKLVDLLQAKAHVEFNSALWRQAVQHSGNRAGLLVSGDLRSAVRILLSEELKLEGEEQTEWTVEAFNKHLDKSEQLRELCAFSVSEEYFQTRQSLGVAASTSEEDE